MKKLGVFLLFFNSIIYSAWYTGWFYRKVITNSFAAGGDLTNFPLLVVISNDTALQSYASNNGYDILFTLKDGTTKLAHEMEYYSNGTIIAWIKIPILSAIEQDSNIIYMYYNTSSSSDQQNKNDVWSENYAGVWHLAETSGDASDSTVNARTAVNKFATEGNGIYPDGTLDTAALIGSGGHFITNDRLETASFDLDLPMTISAWMMADGTAAYWTSYPGSKAFGGFSRCGQSDAASIWKVSDSSMQTRMTILTTNGSGPIITNTALGKNNQAFSTNQWVYVTMTSDHTQTRAHLNGRNYFTTNHLYSDLMYKSFSWNIGMGRYSLPTFSYIDECRLSSVARSTNWLFTEYTNQIDPVSFRTLGAAETFSGVSFSSITPYSSPCLANENTVFTLNACVITGTIASVNISWGDGQSSAYTPGIANISTENYSHEYTARNNFSVTAVVTASSGMAATNSTVISTLPYRFYNPYNLSFYNESKGCLIKWNITSSANITHFNLYRGSDLHARIENPSLREYLDERIIFGDHHSYWLEAVYPAGSVFSSTNTSAGHAVYKREALFGTGGGSVSTLLAELSAPQNALSSSCIITMNILSNSYASFYESGKPVYHQVEIAGDTEGKIRGGLVLKFRIPVTNGSLSFNPANATGYTAEAHKDKLFCSLWDGKTWTPLSTAVYENRLQNNFSFLELETSVNRLGIYGILYNARGMSGDTPLTVKNRVFLPGLDDPDLSSVQISFPNPERAQVKIQVFDMNGKIVKENGFNEWISFWSWNGLDNSGKLAGPGLYIVSIVVGGKRADAHNAHVYLLK